MINFEKLTPMMKQYLDIKSKYTDCILFFRLGDFYEMFFNDAEEASRILDIVLTGKSCGLEEKVPMCGVPFHSSESYIQRLIKNGKKVAICEQIEDPKQAKNIVKRDVVRIITPSTNLNDDSSLKFDKILFSITKINSEFLFVFGDIIEGFILYGKNDLSNILDIIKLKSPNELILFNFDDNASSKLDAYIHKSDILTSYNPNISEVNYMLDEYVYSSNEITSLKNFLGYIQFTQKFLPANFHNIQSYYENEYLHVDSNTMRNLDLLENSNTRTKKNSLFDILDYTKTSMGARCLKNWIERPLASIKDINYRLDIIEAFNKNHVNREEIIDNLKGIYDVNRIVAKITYETATPRDFYLLKKSLENLPKINIILNKFNNIEISKLKINDLNNIYSIINDMIIDEPGSIAKGDIIIKSGYSSELDDYVNLQKNSTQVLLDIETQERQKTGIKNLKVKYNKVFGYYIEISNSNLKDFTVPDNYIRKQTLSNGERYINPELKEIENKILSSQHKILLIQQEIFYSLKEQIKKDLLIIQNTFEKIAIMDAFVSLSVSSLKNNYIRPDINDKSTLKIQDGRHPILENIINEYDYVPNTTNMDKSTSINIITGPNMGGKSTYMRQVAIIALMAHMGSFVPAKSAAIPLLDAIYSRVGASDDLSQGQSTFMVEMDEVSYILKNATQNSLLILDEIGRGTSTFDGMSIAYSIIKYINNNIKSLTLFSTHYHEITNLELEFDSVKNYSVAVKEINDKIIFLKKVVKGRADKSYGIHVAEMANLPSEVIIDAKLKLNSLEKSKDEVNTQPNYQQLEISFMTDAKQNKEMDFNNKIIEKIKSINLNMITPIEALNQLNKIQNILNSNEEN